MEDIFGGLVLLMGGFVSIFAIIALAVVILMIIANIFLFRKMGLPGWYSIIPFWNVYNQVSKTWLVTPWFWVYLGLFVAPWFLDGFLLSVVSILAFALGVANEPEAGGCVREGCRLLPGAHLPTCDFPAYAGVWPGYLHWQPDHPRKAVLTTCT